MNARSAGDSGRVRDLATRPRDEQGLPAVAAREVLTRRAWVDNLRVAVIIGVIGAHVATAYILDIDWYYEERTPTGLSEAVFGMIFGTGLLFGMGLLFLVAGLYTAASFARKGLRRFALGRLMRLGLPLVVFVAVFDPVTDFIGYRGMGGGKGLLAYLDQWWRQDSDLSVMWFVAALLVFSLVYAAWRSIRVGRMERGGRLSAVRLVGFGVFIAVGSFVVRIEWPFASNSLFGLNLWEFPQMIAMFTLGVIAAEHGWLNDALPDRFWRNCGLAAVAGGVMLFVLGAMVSAARITRSWVGCARRRWFFRSLKRCLRSGCPCGPSSGSGDVGIRRDRWHARLGEPRSPPTSCIHRWLCCSASACDRSQWSLS